MRVGKGRRGRFAPSHPWSSTFPLSSHWSLNRRALTVVSDGTRLLELEAVGALEGREVAEGELLEELLGLPRAVHGAGDDLDVDAGRLSGGIGTTETGVAWWVSLRSARVLKRVPRRQRARPRDRNFCRPSRPPGPRSLDSRNTPHATHQRHRKAFRQEPFWTLARGWQRKEARETHFEG